jgi:hypothetical protein
MNIHPAIILLFMIIGATISGVVASAKERSVGGWVLFGMFFPVIAIVAILCLPSRRELANAL